jgi:hypothetical protein
MEDTPRQETARALFGITDRELREARTHNATEKGGFGRRLFLEWSEGGSYKTSTA